MTKVVVNSCFGGFDLSEKAQVDYWNLKGYNVKLVKDTYNNTVIVDEETDKRLYLFDICRDDPVLAYVVEKLGEDANTQDSLLRVEDIPDDVSWYIDDDDGVETIHERHRRW